MPPKVLNIEYFRLCFSVTRCVSNILDFASFTPVLTLAPLPALRIFDGRDEKLCSKRILLRYNFVLFLTQQKDKQISIFTLLFFFLGTP